MSDTVSFENLTAVNMKTVSHLLACDVLCSLTFQRNCIIYPDNRNEFLWNISTYLPDYICTGVDPGFVWPEAYTNSGDPLKKHTQNYKYKIRYKSEYLFRSPPRALEGVHASEGPWSLRFIIFMVNPSLHMHHIPEEKYKFKIILLHLHTLIMHLLYQQFHLCWWENTHVSIKVSLSAVLGGQWCVCVAVSIWSELLGHHW